MLRFQDVEISDLDQFHDYVSQENQVTWLSDLWTDVEDMLDPTQNRAIDPQYMNNQDYTLNSPLLADELDAFLNYLKTGESSPLYGTRVWETRRNWLKKLPVSLGGFYPTRRFHDVCAQLWSKKGVDLSKINQLILETDMHAKDTHDVLKTYVKKWIQKDIPFLSRSINSESTLRYGALMLDALSISWILNATTTYELDELSASLDCSFLNPQNHSEGIMYKSTTLGAVYIGQGILYISSLNMIWDRNMLLMYKDTCTARFQTLLAIQHRQFDKYHCDHLKTIEELYTAGDLLLRHDMKSAYESYGIIEPLASLKLAEMAGSYRPHIPQFPHFRDHIERKIAQMMLANPPSSSFFKIIHGVTDKRILLTIYGSFRHWGHPFIDYMEGLKSLHQNVTAEVQVDRQYADILASDLAFKVLKKQFFSKFKWFIDISKLPQTNPLYEHVRDNTWPSIDVLTAYPPTWHQLPLMKCWDVPEVMDPSLIYSDKTHSITRSELVDCLLSRPWGPIPSKKVLDTLLHTPTTNWKEFLQAVNDYGLPPDDLNIGLKEKEREIKWKGRFYALMSWRLREYFTSTELLIKKNVLPLFKGLTMADDQTTLIKKMLDNTSGQGNKGYDRITIANHFDYEKWNNFQRAESTNPVFKVIGMFHGMPMLFARTHEFFEKSLIYYKGRPDLLKIENGQVVNRYPDQLVCWNGQKGGLEGLRQKGWSVVNLLAIERESKIRNTEIKILAQGDNQVVCTFYKMNPYKSDADFKSNISRMISNNQVIIGAIRDAAARIGLKINEDETLQSADLLIYGKTILFRGNITCLEEKRYSRITCTTNDQLPSLGNILATVSTNSLTVAHYSKSPLNAMVQYNWLANFVMGILDQHNPAIRTAPKNLVSDPIQLKTKAFRIGAIYLDPSIGGISGMSLTRFHLRMFPDPVTEGLTFWKIIALGSSDASLRSLAIGFGNPRILPFQDRHFAKLLEDPCSLNLPKGMSAPNLIKDEIKKAMLENPGEIKNEIIRDAVVYVKGSEDRFISFLLNVTPCFPRFLSEFRSSTFFGLTDQIFGLFQNSKTIRNLFKRQFRSKVDEAIVKCELSSLESLIRSTKARPSSIWSCSAEQADHLRFRSWSRRIIGTTVPHPAEMISRVSRDGVFCTYCRDPIPLCLHITVIVPTGIESPEDSRGPYMPYLGSSTNENTSLVQSWERDTDITFIKKASNMRKAYNWFVDPNSPLGRSINNNLESLTGVPAGATIEGFRRTGSALHRYGCSRVSVGGYIANNSMYGSRMIISTDNFQLLGETNYDFMYQSLILYSQQTVGEIQSESPEPYTYHAHISCLKCLRTIEEPLLQSKVEFTFPDMSAKLDKWKPSDTPWMKEPISISIPKGNWDLLDQELKIQEIGILHGLMFGHLNNSYTDSNVLKGLFPIGIRDKMDGSSYLKGLVDGLFRASLLDATRKRIFYRTDNVETVVYACYLRQVTQITQYPDFLTFMQGKFILDVIQSHNHRIPPSYPLNQGDIGKLIKSYLGSKKFDDWKSHYTSNRRPTWIFADFVSVPLSGIIIVAQDLMHGLFRYHPPQLRQLAKGHSDIIASLRSGECQSGVQNLIKSGGTVLLCTQEVRHAIKSTIKRPLMQSYSPETLSFTNVINFPVNLHSMEYSIVPETEPSIEFSRIQNPLISGLRIPQIATGAFLKIECLLNHLGLRPEAAICGGDGSGGISALILRKYANVRLIFNSLLCMDNVELSGTLPSPPSAIAAMDISVSSRCVNLNNVWELSQDLSKMGTWEGFIKLKRRFNLHLNLGVFDMEVRDSTSSDQIEDLMRKYIPRLMTIDSTVIYKTYASRLVQKNSILTRLGDLFHVVMLTQNELSSSHTSEIYVVMQRLRSGGVLRYYPRWTPTLDWISNIYCQKSYLDEFNRARRVLKVDLTMGIPSLFLADPREELFSLWESLSPDRIGLVRWFTSLDRYKHDLGSFLLGAVTLISNTIINTTRWASSSLCPVPSDGDLSKLMAHLIGVLLYIALVNGDPDLGELAQSLINTPFYIFLYLKKEKTSKFIMSQRSAVSWSIYPQPQYKKYKRVFVQHKMALIGATIRIALSVSKRPGGHDVEEVIDGLHLVNRALSFEHVKHSTGVLDLLL